jgi:hypothetical protein
MERDSSDPRSILEEKESEHENTHEELAFALGRLLVWLLEAQDIHLIGQRVYVAAYKLRPDLIGGATLQDIAKMTGHGRSKAHNLSRELSDILGIRGLNDRGDKLSTPRYRRAWARSHKTGRQVPFGQIHLGLINRFVEWNAKLMAKGSEITPSLRAQMRRELEPIRRLIDDLGPAPLMQSQATPHPGKESIRKP